MQVDGNPQFEGRDPPSLGVAGAARLLASLREDEMPVAVDVTLPSVEGYVVLERLGRGGGGSVYLAHRTGGDSECPVALKILSMPVGVVSAGTRGSGGERGSGGDGVGGVEGAREGRWGDAAGVGGAAWVGGEGSRRAWRELGLLSELRLPCLPRVLDYGLAGGRLYIAAEYIDGVPLDEFCRGRDLDRRARVELLARIADAVGSLHEHGVIHRDLKPSNILVSAAGDPMIIDLGIASLMTASVMETLTADGAPVGTPAYMAPEQARGERAAISTRSDIYALGATAYQVLAGATPHDLAGVTLAEAVHRVAHAEPRPPQAIDPSLPRPLAAILAKACDPAPQRRYDTAAALAADLRRWLRGEPVEATPPGVWLRGARWVGRHPVVTTAAACIAVGGAIFGATFLSVRWVSMEPVSYRVSEHPWELQVLARNGAVVHSWPVWWGDAPKSFVEFVSEPRSLGGRRLAVSAVYESVRRGYLEVSDASNISRPIWSTLDPPVPFSMPPRPEEGWQVSPGELRLRSAIVADVFPGPEYPGKEIIATFSGQHHPTAIRIYSLSGEVLFEAWHPGISGVERWIPGTRQVILGGANGETSWAQLGYPVEDITHLWPMVVYAIEPQPHQHGGWIVGPYADGVVTPAWYKFLAPWPTTVRDLSVKAFCQPFDAARQHDSFRLELEFRGGGGFDWTIDRDGVIVAESLYDCFDTRFNPGRPQHKVRPSEFVWLTDVPPSADEHPPAGPLPPPRATEPAG